MCSNRIWILCATVIFCVCANGQGCYYGGSVKYNGTLSTTLSGKQCQRWDSQLPNAHLYTNNTMFPMDGSVKAANNYCRSPNASGVWCVTTDTKVITEQCDVLPCRDFTIAVYTLTADYQCLDVGKSDWCDTNWSEKHLCYHEDFTIADVIDDNCTDYLCCAKKDCYNGSPSNYTGRWSFASNMVKCLSWALFNSTTLEPNAFPEKSITKARNYCRDPTRTGTPSCVIANEDSGVLEIKPCNIPTCETAATLNRYDNDCYKVQVPVNSKNGRTTDQELCEALGMQYQEPSVNKPGCNGCPCCQTKDCFSGTSWDYNGKWSRTISGRKCKRWDQSSLRVYTETASLLFPDGSLAAAENYCRDPQLTDKPSGYVWCEIDDPVIQFEMCTVPSCSETSFGRLTTPRTLITTTWDFWGGEVITLPDLPESVTGEVLVEHADDTYRCRVATGGCFSAEVLGCQKPDGEVTFDSECFFEVLCCAKRGCLNESSYQYSGNWNYSALGEVCSTWNKYGYLFENKTNLFPLAGDIDTNYCRDPYKQGTLSCYANGTLVFCGIPDCKEESQRHTYDHDCYTLTQKDKLYAPGKASDKVICEMLGKMYLEGPSPEFPGCQGCSCCQMKDCMYNDTASYDGSWSRTISGRKCKRWEESFFAEYQLDLVPGLLVDYCRDWLNEGYLWCFTTDPNTIFEYCSIDPCNDSSTIPPTGMSPPWTEDPNDFFTPATSRTKPSSSATTQSINTNAKPRPQERPLISKTTEGSNIERTDDPGLANLKSCSTRHGVPVIALMFVAIFNYPRLLTA